MMLKKFHEDVNKVSGFTYVIILFGSWQFGQFVASTVEIFLRGLGILN